MGSSISAEEELTLRLGQAQSSLEAQLTTVQSAIITRVLVLERAAAIELVSRTAILATNAAVAVNYAKGSLSQEQYQLMQADTYYIPNAQANNVRATDALAKANAIAQANPNSSPAAASLADAQFQATQAASQLAQIIQSRQITVQNIAKDVTNVAAAIQKALDAVAASKAAQAALDALGPAV